MSDAENPLLSPSPLAWEGLIEAVDPPALLLVIERRMSAALRATHTAEDVLQEALLQAWKSRAECQWRGLPSFRSWLLTIVDHRIGDLADRALAAKRDGGRAPVHFSALEQRGSSTTSASAGFPSASTTPSRLAVYREQADVIARTLESLPDDVREVVRLRLLEQEQLEPICARTGLTIEAVRHRLRKGTELYVRRLRAALGTRTGADGDSPPAAGADSSPREVEPPER